MPVSWLSAGARTPSLFAACALAWSRRYRERTSKPAAGATQKQIAGGHTPRQVACPLPHGCMGLLCMRERLRSPIGCKCARLQRQERPAPCPLSQPAQGAGATLSASLTATRGTAEHPPRASIAASSSTAPSPSRPSFCTPTPETPPSSQASPPSHRAAATTRVAMVCGRAPSHRAPVAASASGCVASGIAARRSGPPATPHHHASRFHRRCCGAVATVRGGRRCANASRPPQCRCQTPAHDGAWRNDGATASLPPGCASSPVPPGSRRRRGVWGLTDPAPHRCHRCRDRHPHPADVRSRCHP